MPLCINLPSPDEPLEFSLTLYPSTHTHQHALISFLVLSDSLAQPLSDNHPIHQLASMLFGAPCASTLALVVGLAVLTLNVARVAGAPPMPGPSTTTTQRGATADKSRLARERADACYRSAFARPSGGKPPQALKGPLDFAKRVDMWLLRNVQGRDFCGQLSPAAIAAEATPGWTKAPQTMGVFKRLSSEQRQRYLQCYEQKRKVNDSKPRCPSP